MVITYEGKTYETIKTLAKTYEIDYEHLCRLLRNGWTVDDAMKICREKVYGIGKIYEYEGRAYRSPKKLAETYGLPKNSLVHFLARCNTVEEAVKRCREQQEEKIILWGREYRNRHEIAETFGVNYSSINYGVNCKRMSLEETIQELLKKEPILFEGKSYQTITDLCVSYQVQPCNVLERLLQGKTLYEAVYVPVRNNGKVFEKEFEGKIYQNAAFLCREYHISKLLVEGQRRYEKEKTFMDCFRLVKQLRDECGWPRDKVFSYIPRCKVEGIFYKNLADFSRTIGMTTSMFNAYKFKHHCKNIIETFQKMQKDYIPAYYHAEYGLLTYTQTQEMHISSKERKEMLYKKEGIPRYPALQQFDFKKDCMDILYRYEELFEKKSMSKEIER